MADKKGGGKARRPQSSAGQAQAHNGGERIPPGSQQSTSVSAPLDFEADESVGSLDTIDRGSWEVFDMSFEDYSDSNIPATELGSTVAQDSMDSEELHSGGRTMEDFTANGEPAYQEGPRPPEFGFDTRVFQDRVEIEIQIPIVDTDLGRNPGLQDELNEDLARTYDGRFEVEFGGGMASRRVVPLVVRSVLLPIGREDRAEVQPAGIGLPQGISMMNLPSVEQIREEPGVGAHEATHYLGAIDEYNLNDARWSDITGLAVEERRGHSSLMGPREGSAFGEPRVRHLDDVENQLQFQEQSEAVKIRAVTVENE